MENLNLTESQLSYLACPAPAVGSEKSDFIVQLSTKTSNYEVYYAAFLSHVIDKAFEGASKVNYLLDSNKQDPVSDEHTKVFLKHYKSEYAKGLLSVILAEENPKVLQGLDSSNTFENIALEVFTHTLPLFVNDLIDYNPKNDISTAYDTGKLVAEVIIRFFSIKDLADDICQLDEIDEDFLTYLLKESEGSSNRFIKSYDCDDKLAINN